MNKYFFNCLITAVVCAVVGIITFLIGKQGGEPVYSAVTAGIAAGVVIPTAYLLGGMMEEDGKTFNGVRYLVMLAVGILFGFLGGYLITVG